MMLISVVLVEKFLKKGIKKGCLFERQPFLNAFNLYFTNTFEVAVAPFKVNSRL
jgi:hypothetical protein